MKRPLQNALLTAATLVLSLAAAEGVLRLTTQKHVGEYDPLGWREPENASMSQAVQDTPGNHRRIQVAFHKHGFKRWPKPRPGQPRILVVGDSFTAMSWVANGEEWYSVLEERFPGAAFYVSGVGGYSSLQEYLLMRLYGEQIKPDAILWQFCSNDYDNNYFEADRRLYPLNNIAPRPYLEGNRIELRMPTPLSGLRRYSALANAVMEVVDRHQQKRKQHLSRKEKAVIQDAIPAPLHRAAEAVTARIFALVHAWAGPRPVFFFNACGDSAPAEEDICAAQGFECLDDFHRRLAERAGHRRITVVGNAHWNLLGNRLAGEVLADWLSSQAGFPGADEAQAGE